MRLNDCPYLIMKLHLWKRAERKQVLPVCDSRFSLSLPCPPASAFSLTAMERLGRP